MVEFGPNNQYGDVIIIGLFTIAVGVMLDYATFEVAGYWFTDTYTTIGHRGIPLYTFVAFTMIFVAWLLNKPSFSSWNSQQKALTVVTPTFLILDVMSDSFRTFVISESWITLTVFGLLTGGMWVIMSSN